MRSPAPVSEVVVSRPDFPLRAKNVCCRYPARHTGTPLRTHVLRIPPVFPSKRTRAPRFPRVKRLRHSNQVHPFCEQKKRGKDSPLDVVCGHGDPFPAAFVGQFGHVPGQCPRPSRPANKTNRLHGLLGCGINGPTFSGDPGHRPADKPTETSFNGRPGTLFKALFR